MRLHSLRARIAVVFVLLMIVVQVVAFAVIHTAISSNARNNADDQLSVAERVFKPFASRPIRCCIGCSGSSRP